jgi:hypothetical protein
VIPRGTAMEHFEVPDCNRSTNIDTNFGYSQRNIEPIYDHSPNSIILSKSCLLDLPISFNLLRMSEKTNKGKLPESRIPKKPDSQRGAMLPVGQVPCTVLVQHGIPSVPTTRHR